MYCWTIIQKSAKTHSYLCRSCEQMLKEKDLDNITLVAKYSSQAEA